MAGKKIGILALQGAFAEHEDALKRCGVDALQVKTADQIEEIDGLIIPGGESTTIGNLMCRYGLDSKIKEMEAKGMPIWGTCAGMVLLAKEIVDSEQFRLGLMSIRVKRNAFGRQVDSFEADLDVVGIGKTKGVFIRAPYVEKIWGEAKVLSEYEGKIVMVEEGKKLATAFHPELTEELGIYKYFLDKV
ncbi:MAG: pyridoxal 5'-phosphate synthase glutaminase subunit PdxT [Syntrophomonadaceae bacterium]|nr:pyridoxal 5'-phosphate synthase glutaminase subunit PdxT [Syntrophomonadaceae bacterium]